MAVAKEKVFSVDFMYYTDLLETTVCTEPEEKNGVKNYADCEYLEVRDLLVRETELYKYKKYGGGFRNLHFVGYLMDGVK